MTKKFITVKGMKYYADLSWKEITDIREIEGLEALTDLKELILNHNQLTEIKGLETLTNLRELNLTHNKIIKAGRPLVDYISRGGIIERIVEYCQEKAKKSKEGG